MPQLTVRGQMAEEPAVTLYGPPPVPPPSSSASPFPPANSTAPVPPPPPPPEAPPGGAVIPIDQPIKQGFWGKSGNLFKGNNCNSSCSECGWVTMEYLLWWLQPGPLNAPLVTSGPYIPVVPPSLGASQSTILNNSPLNYGPISGARIDGGFWFDSNHCLGVEVGGFLLAKVGTTQTFASDPLGFPSLGRPVVYNGTVLTVPVSAFGLYNGVVKVSSTSQLGGCDVNLLTSPWHGANLCVTFLGGFRYLNLSENLQIQQSTYNNTVAPLTLPFQTPLTVPPFSQVYLGDGFRTSNQFFGGQIGARLQSQFGALTLGLQGKLGIGGNVQSIKIDGLSQVGGLVLPQGVLAEGSNIGTHTRSTFSLVPELGVDVGWKLTQHVQLLVGYNILYWTNVIRPGDQIESGPHHRRVPSGRAVPQ